MTCGRYELLDTDKYLQLSSVDTDNTLLEYFCARDEFDDLEKRKLPALLHDVDRNKSLRLQLFQGITRIVVYWLSF